MSSELDALQAALAAEHACVWGYAVVGAHLLRGQYVQAETDDAAHRDRRDAVIAAITRLRAQPVVAEAAYALPFAVTSATTAIRLAVLLESRTGAAWRAVLAATTDAAVRTTALDALGDTAVRAAQWRRASGAATITVPFPGQT